jgi:dipeptidyl aminopeptidase/acylaminoacyl peptidase
MSPEVAMRSVVHSCVRALALVCLFVPADGRLGRSLALPQEAGSAGASPSRLGPALQQDNAKADKVEAKKAEELKLEDLFPKKSMFGKRARGVAWSHDDRYLAYLWNAYDDKGYDLWVYDTKEKKARRITSPELFVAFDRELKPIIERYKKDKEEDERRKKLSDDERKKLEEEDEKKEKERKEPLKEYGGVGEVEWASKSNELLFTYGGDIYRIEIGKDAPTRLTKTTDGESGLKYTRDDKGFFFRRGEGVFRARFDSPECVQLNPTLPDGMRMGGYRLSPDETRILLTASKQTGKDREVTYVTYRQRFAEARTAGRAVADDPFNSEQRVYIVDLNDDPKATPLNEGKPWEIYKWPAGDELGQFIVHAEPWSPDSKKLAFATWKRTKRELEVCIADTVEKKVTTVYRTTHNGEHTTPGMTDPFFRKDGSTLLAVLEQSGYRQLWEISPLTAGATQLTRGDYELYPVKLSEDGSWVLAQAAKESPARLNYYRVNLTDGSVDRLTSRDGSYSDAVMSHDNKKLAVMFGSWRSQTELYVQPAIGKRDEVAVTASHPGTLEKVHKLTAELFTFKNRHGQTVSGYLHRPPNWKKGDKRPLLIYTYGGPLGTGHSVVDGAFGGDGYWLPMWMAWKHGYVCATIDPRGSSGYGGLFGNANWEQPGKAQVEDISDAVKYLDETYGVDRKKVAVHGWSFGGFQTQMCMYTAPDVFTLGIAGAGPTEWQNYNNWYSGGVIGAAKVGKPDELDKYSLTKLAKNLKGDLMLLHGLEDTNVLAQDTIKVYRELLQAGKGPLVELVLDPTGGHGLGGDIKGKERFLMYEAFILRRWGR